ncbi:MAG: metal-dependent hydrolase [Promethearchaeota archaeon]
MDPFTHLMVGRLLFSLFFENMDRDFLYFALIFTVLPDFDIFIAPFKKILNWNYLEHRGGSHSFIIGIILSLIGSFIFTSITSQLFLHAFFLGICFYSLHIVLDLLNTTKIPIFYPLSKREKSYYVEKAGSMFTMFFSVVFFIILFLSDRYGAPNSSQITRTIMTFLFMIYYLFRIVVKLIVQKRKTINQKYFPGFFPHQYYLFESNCTNHNIQLNLEQKNIFTKNTRLISKAFDLSPEEMELFTKAIVTCDSNYYRNKTTKFPIILKENDKFSVRLYVLETIMNSKSMYLQYDFEPKTGNLVDENQSYGIII